MSGHEFEKLRESRERQLLEQLRQESRDSERWWLEHQRHTRRMDWLTFWMGLIVLVLWLATLFLLHAPRAIRCP